MPTDASLIPGATSTLRRRIYAKIERGATRDACCYWRGKTVIKRDRVRRGAIGVGGRGSRTVSVARLLLVLRDRVPLVARDAARLEAGHTCHHYWCVNVRHLKWVTRLQNEREKSDARRYAAFADDVDELAATERAARPYSS